MQKTKKPNRIPKSPEEIYYEKQTKNYLAPLPFIKFQMSRQYSLWQETNKDYIYGISSMKSPAKPPDKNGA
jgi:hypothetical protein